MVTLIDRLLENEETRGASKAFRLVDADGNVEGESTYEELAQRARRVAMHVAEHAAPQTPILVTLPFSIDYVAAVLGILFAGAVAVPLFPLTGTRKRARVQAIASDCGAKFAIAPAQATDAGLLERFAASCNIDLIRVRSGQDAGEFHPVPRRDDLAIIQYTSGSTRTPRGVVLRHRHLLENLLAIQDAFNQSPDSIVVGWTPLFHDMGLMGTALQTVVTGSQCILVKPSDFVRRPALWLETISRYRATTSGGPNFGYNLCIDCVTVADLDLSSWNVAYSGAERVQPATLEGFVRRFGQYGFHREAFVPCYGLAEATLLVAAERIGSGPYIAKAGATPIVSCGYLARDVTVRIVDHATGTERADDEPGEIWVSGPSVAEEYWNRPDDSAATFVRDASTAGSTPFVRTGDLGFMREGRLYVTGRLKDVIVLRGTNCVAEDVEATVRSAHPGLVHAATAAFQLTGSDEEALGFVAEVPLVADYAAVVRAICRALRQDYQIKPAWVGLVREGTLPRTTSGKIQRGACARARELGTLKCIHLWSPHENSVALAPYGDPLLNDIGIAIGWPLDAGHEAHTLSDLGLDSLGAAELCRRLLLRTGAGVRPEVLLAGTSIEALRRILSQSNSRAPIARRSETEKESPLSHGQEGLWFLARMRPNSLAASIVRVFATEATFDSERFEGACRIAIARHPMLRAEVFQVQGQPRQRISAVARSDWFINMDGSHWSATELWSELRRCAYAVVDPRIAPLLRVIVVTWRHRRFICFTIHHLIADLWSLELLAHDVARLYAGRSPTQLTDSPTYFDYVSWMRDCVQGPEGDRAWAFWKRLAGHRLAQPTGESTLSPVAVATTRCIAVDRSIAAQLEHFAREEHSSLMAVLFAAYARTLALRFDSQEQLIAMPVHARPPEMQDVVGYCTNLMLVPVSTLPGASFRDLLRQVNGILTEALEHSWFPLQEVVRRAQLHRDARRPSVARYVFAHQSGTLGGQLSAAALVTPGEIVDVFGLRLEVVGIEEPVHEWDIGMWTAVGDDGAIRATLRWKAKGDEKPLVEAFVETFRAVLDSVCSRESDEAAANVTVRVV